MFDWGDARILLAVHREGSLSAAGRKLGLNQSTVGRRLKALEDALGMKPFVQTPAGLVVSPGGERLVEHAARMEDEAFALERDASGAESVLAGTVRVTGPDAVSVRMLAPILAAMHARLPGIDVELVADNRTLSLSKREADMAVRTARPEEATSVMRRVCGFASAVYASSAYLARHGRPRERDLGRHPWVSVEDPGWQESLWLEKVAPGARVVFKTNSTLAQLVPTRAGLGLGVLPCYVGDAEADLVRVVEPERCVARALWLVVHRDLQRSHRIRAVADTLFEALAAEAARFEGRAAP